MSKARDLADLGSVTARLDEVGNSDGALSNRNKIINGRFRIDQRNIGNAHTLQSGYTVDRFRVHGPVASMFTVQRQATGVRVTRNSSGAGFGHFGTPLEQQDMLPFVGQEVTVSFKARGSGSIAQQFNVVDTPSATSGTSTPIASGLSYNVTTAWQRFSFTFTMPSSLSYACVYINLAQYGDSYMASGAWLEFDEVQFEQGNVVTPYEYRSYGQELLLCKRFYHKTPSSFEASVLNRGWDSNNGLMTGSKHNGYYDFVDLFPVEMRTAPSLALFAQSGTGYLRIEIPGVTNREISASPQGTSTSAVGMQARYFLTSETDRSEWQSGSGNAFGRIGYAVDAEL